MSIERRVAALEKTMGGKPWLNRPLTEEEEEALFEILAEDFSQPGRHLSGFTAEQEVELRDWYVKKLEDRRMSINSNEGA